MDGKAGLRIAFSNQKVENIFLLFWSVALDLPLSIQCSNVNYMVINNHSCMVLILPQCRPTADERTIVLMNLHDLNFGGWELNPYQNT